MPRGARGNSGVILSLLFRGFSKGLKDKTTANGADIAEALASGVESAYKAVMKPTEGTILTVARVASEKAAELARQTNDPIEIFECIFKNCRGNLGDNSRNSACLEESRSSRCRRKRFGVDF